MTFCPSYEFRSSLRAKRSNPESFHGNNLDCFVASLLAMTKGREGASPRHDLPELCQSSRPGNQRAQGMPGDGLTHGPPAEKNAGGSDHRFSRINRHSPRNGLRLIRDLPGVRALIATVVERNTCFAQLDPSVGESGPHDFAVHVRHARPACRPRPSHPRPTYRDDRPKRPSSPRRDAREHRRDLPDATSAHACGRLARRAVWAWGACGNYPSGAYGPLVS